MALPIHSRNLRSLATGMPKTLARLSLLDGRPSSSKGQPSSPTISNLVPLVTVWLGVPPRWRTTSNASARVMQARGGAQPSAWHLGGRGCSRTRRRRTAGRGPNKPFRLAGGVPGQCSAGSACACGCICTDRSRWPDRSIACLRSARRGNNNSLDHLAGYCTGAGTRVGLAVAFDDGSAARKYRSRRRFRRHRTAQRRPTPSAKYAAELVATPGAGGRDSLHGDLRRRSLLPFDLLPERYSLRCAGNRPGLSSPDGGRCWVLNTGRSCRDLDWIASHHDFCARTWRGWRAGHRLQSEARYVVHGSRSRIDRGKYRRWGNVYRYVHRRCDGRFGSSTRGRVRNGFNWFRLGRRHRPCAARLDRQRRHSGLERRTVAYRHGGWDFPRRLCDWFRDQRHSWHRVGISWTKGRWSVALRMIKCDDLQRVQEGEQIEFRFPLCSASGRQGPGIIHVLGCSGGQTADKLISPLA